MSALQSMSHNELRQCVYRPSDDWKAAKEACFLADAGTATSEAGCSGKNQKPPPKPHRT